MNNNFTIKVLRLNISTSRTKPNTPQYFTSQELKHFLYE